MAKDDDILDEARELFRQCEEREADNRDEALDDLEFARLARQWRPEDEEQRANEGRPCLTINRMPAFIRQVVNDARQNTPAISVRAVDDAADPATADLDRLLGASQFNAGMALDVARTNVANDMAGANFRLNASNVMAGLSNHELEQELRRAGALSAVGDAQQQNQQARDDAAYEEFMRMIGYPAQQQAIAARHWG